MRFILLTLIASALMVFIAYQPMQSAVKAATETVALQTQTDDFQRISLEDAKKEFDAGTAIIVDARGKDEFKTEHIKGAISFPYDDFDKKFKKLPKDKKIIVYCSCPSEHTSGMTVQKFNENNFKNAYAMIGGTKAWKAAGYPMAQGK